MERKPIMELNDELGELLGNDVAKICADCDGSGEVSVRDFEGNFDGYKPCICQL